MGLFQHTVTIYNKYTKGLDNWQGGLPPASSIAWERTIIHNAMWKDKVHYQANGGKSFIDKTISITIPLNEMEAEGGKRYAQPKEYASLRVASENIWTLQIGDIIVLGECNAEITASYTITNLRNEYKSMEISTVSDSTDQGILPKWKIEGV